LKIKSGLLPHSLVHIDRLRGGAFLLLGIGRIGAGFYFVQFIRGGCVETYNLDPTNNHST
jgi:hypothetical protein